MTKMTSSKKEVSGQVKKVFSDEFESDLESIINYINSDKVGTKPFSIEEVYNELEFQNLPEVYERFLLDQLKEKRDILPALLDYMDGRAIGYYSRQGREAACKNPDSGFYVEPNWKDPRL